MESRKITEFFKPGPAGPPLQPLSSKLPPLRRPSKKPVGWPRKWPLELEDEVPLRTPLGKVGEGKKLAILSNLLY